MTIDDRGRRAAESLRRSVQAQVEVDQALADLSARPGPSGTALGPRWQKPLAVAAAVLVLVLVAGVAISAQGGGRTGTDMSLRKDELGNAKKMVEQLPSSAIDGKGSLRLPVLADPQTGLHDGQEVTVAGRGFEPGELIGVVMCGSEADSASAGVDACQLGEGFSKVLTRVNASSDGVASATVKVQRFIDTESKGRIDCTEVAERCLLAMASASDYDRSGGAYLLFAGSPPFPTPELSVAPPADLVARQRVTVTGSGLVPGRSYRVQQCVGDRCQLRQLVIGGILGDAKTSITVSPTVTDADGEVDCKGRCVIRLTGWRAKGGTSIPFPADVGISFAEALTGGEGTASSVVPTSTTVVPTSTTAGPSTTTTTEATSTTTTVPSTTTVP